MRPAALTWGAVPVPFVASWTGEDRTFLAVCPHARRPAICQAEARGAGKPKFGSPHAGRQREAIACGLCDLCGTSLKTRTKVSLSHARPVAHSAGAWEILQVEPLLHRECAAISLFYCPSLQRDIASGEQQIRQVTAYAVQMAIMSPEYVETLTGVRRKAVGHAKVQLKAWINRDADWLARAA